MGDFTSIRLKTLHGRLGELAYELTKVQFSYLVSPEAWRPAINAYRCSSHISICVDLAGVDREALEVKIEHRRLSIRGSRRAPEPSGTESQTLQVLAMEIDYGPFLREVELPTEVDIRGVTAEQRNGLLWISLPLRPES